MANKSKAKGTKYETSVTNYFNEWCGEKVCERVVLHGNRDHGDLRLYVADLVLAVECKWREKYPNDAEESDFRKQTITETENAKTDGGILVMNRYRNGIERHEVWTTDFVIAKLYGDDTFDGCGLWLCMRLKDFCRLCFGPQATLE